MMVQDIPDERIVYFALNRTLSGADVQIRKAPKGRNLQTKDSNNLFSP